MFMARRWQVLAGVIALPLLWASSAGAAPNPPGNNGTVKVEGEAVDQLHDNDPHVGCDFFVQWYGFDEGARTTTATFDAQAPTGSGQTLMSETFTFDGHGSGNALDAQRAFDLTPAVTSLTPSHQGFHIRLTVQTDGSQGADLKHKVFWVSGCGQETTSAHQAPAQSANESGPAAGAATASLPQRDVAASTVAATGSTPEIAPLPSSPARVAAAAGPLETQVEGEQIIRAESAAAETQTSQRLARTGANGVEQLVATGLGLVAAGAVLVLTRRRLPQP